jgi:hypothetical protein
MGVLGNLRLHRFVPPDRTMLIDIEERPRGGCAKVAEWAQPVKGSQFGWLRWSGR